MAAGYWEALLRLRRLTRELDDATAIASQMSAGAAERAREAHGTEHHEHLVAVSDLLSEVAEGVAGAYTQANQAERALRRLGPAPLE